VGPDHPPRLIFIEPLNGTTARDEIELIWYMLDLDGDGVDIELSYAPVDNASDLTAITGLSDVFRYTWDVSGVTDGYYRVHANVTAGNGGYIALSGEVFVNHNRPPSVAVVEPDGTSDAAHDLYDITWTAHDEDDDVLTFTIHRSQDMENMTLIVQDLTNVTLYSWNVSLLAEGEYWVHVEAWDGVETSASWSDGPLTIDHVPAIEVTAPPVEGAEADEGYTIEWTSWNASEDAVVHIYYDVDTSGDDLEIVKTDLGDDGSYAWDLENVPDGEYHVYIVLTDGDFSATAWSPGALTVDHPGGSEPKNHKPTIRIHDPDPRKNNTANEEFTITWTADDEDGDEVYIRLQYDEDDQVGDGVNITNNWVLASLSEWDWDTTEVPEGKYYVYAVVDDANGSQAHRFSDGKVTIVHPEPGENTAPTIAIETPEDGEYVNGTIWINGTAHDADGNDDIERVRIRIGSLKWKTCDGTTEWSYEWDASNDDNGEITITVEVEDGEGATGTDEITVTVDNFIPEPPWVQISEPTHGETVTGNVTIQGIAGGDLTIESVTLTIDGEDVGNVGGEDWEYEWDSSDVLYGTITITVTVEDEDGMTNSTSINVTVNNIPPTVNQDPTISVDSGPIDVKKGNIAAIEVTVDDPDGLSDIVSVYADLRDTQGNTVLEIPGSELSWLTGTVHISIDTSDLEVGSYTLFIFVVDSSDGGDTATWSFVVVSDKDDDEGGNAFIYIFLFIITASAILLFIGSRRGKRPEEDVVRGNDVDPGGDVQPSGGQPPPPPPDGPVDMDVYEIEVIE